MTGKKDKAGTEDAPGTGPGFTPFADDAAARTIGTLSIENGTGRIALHGSLDITRDRAGLADARLLRDTLEAVVRALEAGDLPETVADTPDIPARTARNPFA